MQGKEKKEKAKKKKQLSPNTIKFLVKISPNFSKNLA